MNARELADAPQSLERAHVLIAVLYERFDQSAAVLKVQANEYERRLGELNHAHHEAKRILDTYVTRDVYDRSMDELLRWRRETDNHISSTIGLTATAASNMQRISELEGWRHTVTGKTSAGNWILGTIFTLIGIALGVAGVLLKE